LDKVIFSRGIRLPSGYVEAEPDPSRPGSKALKANWLNVLRKPLMSNGVVIGLTLGESKCPPNLVTASRDLINFTNLKNNKVSVW
jgi:hypothetical protein